MNWLEVSLTVNGELAEAVAEVLARFVPGGVVVESTAIYADPEDHGYPVGPLRVCGYLPMDVQLEETRQRIEEALYFLGRIQPLPDPQFKPIEEVNWAEAWKQHYKPIAIGKKLVIVPAWLDSPDESRISIRIDPGMAFGTGTHPTTQLCLELLEVELLEAWKVSIYLTSAAARVFYRSRPSNWAPHAPLGWILTPKRLLPPSRMPKRIWSLNP